MQPPNFNGPPGGSPPGFGTGQPQGQPQGPQGQPQQGQPGGQPQQGNQQWGQAAPGHQQPQPGAAGGQQGWGQPQQPGWGAQGGAPQAGQGAAPGGFGAQQPGGFGAQQPGGFGAQQGGFGGAPQAGFGGAQGGFGAPAPGGFGSHARSNIRPPKTGPNIALAIVKIAVGGFFLLGIFIGLVAAGYQGYGISLALALFLGACVWACASGVADIMKKKLSWQVSLGIAGGVVLLCTAIGPTMSTAYQESNEKGVFEKLSLAQETDEYFGAYRWESEYAYKIDKRFHRKEWRSKFFSARVSTALRDKNHADLRKIVQDIDKDKNKADLKEPRKEASDAFRKFYAEAKKKLYSGKTGSDTKLRDAFSAVLDDLATATDSSIHVAFVNKVNLDEPKGSSRVLRLYRNDAKARRAFPKGAPVIKAGSAFSPRYDKRRRRTFITAMSESFSQVFDSNMVALVPLEEGKSRDNKIVLEVGSSIYRIADYYNYNRTSSTGVKTFAGLLFAIEVSWGFKLYDRNGKVIYAPDPEKSLPAESLRVSRGDNDPLWAMYSVMMDSAYYNYSRKVTGKFGLRPPPEKKFFKYQGG